MAKFLRISVMLVVFFTAYELRTTNYQLLYAEDKIVAIVNNEVVTQKDLNDFLNFTRMQLSSQYKGKDLQEKMQSMKMDLLNKLIEDRLILNQAHASNIAIDQSRIKARVNELKKHYSSELDFQRDLTQQGLTQADLENKIRDQFLSFSVIDLKVRSKIVVNPSEVTDFYEKNKEQFIIPEERIFNVIVTDNKEAAQEAYNKLAAGASLQDVREKLPVSVDTISAHKQGDYAKDIEDVMFGLKPGETSRPLEVNNIQYIFILDKINPPRQRTLFEAQDLVYQFIYENKMQQELLKWLDELKTKAYIKIIQH